ncbi:PAC2 family protein [Candidatus Micrarchaeota archaeon]|nr:PAC2 family protein [Candidatus Micrarchaeota archaeon]
MEHPTFTESFIRVKKKPSLKKPLLIVGLPGVGLVSKLAVDHLVKEFKAEKVATLYSPHFPNQVLAMKSGRLRSFSIGFYEKKFKNRDVLLVRGDLQPLTVEGQFEVAAKILEYARVAGCVDAIAMAGYATPEKKAKPAIYCACTDKGLFKRMNSFGATKPGKIVPIVGMAGVLPAMAKLYEMNGCCLLVETPGTPMDAAGAKALLEFISKMTGQKMAFATLEARVKKAEKLFARMQPQQTPTLQPPAIPEAVSRDALRYIR